MSEYFKYEALDIPAKPATEVLKSKGLDLDSTSRQYQYIPELNTGDFHINGLNLDGYFSINKAKEPAQYKYTQLKLNHNTPNKNKQILEQTLDKYGITGNKKTTLMKIASLESRFNPKAQSKNSSAAGYFQFVDSTRKSYSNLSREQFKNSPDAQVLAASQLYDDNARFLRNNGIAVTGEAIAASWLNPTWAKNYYKYGIAEGSDANGTNVVKYINKFRNAKYQRGNVVPVRATPTLKKKSWESEEDYQDRMKKIQNKDSQLFSNIKVTPNTNNSLLAKSNLIQNAMQADINTSQSIKAEQAVRNQVQKKLDKWKDYKNGLDAVLTAIELGLSGSSILGAYSKWRKWGTATSAIKRAVANFLQKSQIPMQVGSTLIDGYQTYDAIKNNNTFETAWNATSGTLGVAGTLGASDVTRYHNSKIDLVLDMLGLTGNVGDFIRFGFK